MLAAKCGRRYLFPLFSFFLRQVGDKYLMVKSLTNRDIFFSRGGRLQCVIFVLTFTPYKKSDEFRAKIIQLAYKVNKDPELKNLWEKAVNSAWMVCDMCAGGLYDCDLSTCGHVCVCGGFSGFMSYANRL